MPNGRGACSVPGGNAAGTIRPTVAPMRPPPALTAPDADADVATAAGVFLKLVGGADVPGRGRVLWGPGRPGDPSVQVATYRDGKAPAERTAARAFLLSGRWLQSPGIMAG